MTKTEKNYFHGGANCALHVVYTHDGDPHSVLYRDIVGSFGLSNLLNACEDFAEAEMIGLAKHAGLDKKAFLKYRKGTHK